MIEALKDILRAQDAATKIWGKDNHKAPPRSQSSTC